MSKKYDLLVIGAGPAGMTAAIYGSRAGLNVGMIELGAPGGQMVNTHEIENYTGFKKIGGPELSMEMFNHSQEQGVEYIYGNVIKIEDGKFKKVICEEEIYEAIAVIIATGTKHNKLGVPNEDIYSNGGISWCAICDGAFHKGKPVAVIGGGNSAIEEALYLTSLAEKVTIIHRREELRADQVAQDRAKNNDKIHFEFNSTVEEFVGDGKDLSGVKIINKETGETKIVEATGAFEYVGQSPNTKMVETLDILTKSSYIEVNKDMETKIPGIFGAGDVTDKHLRQVATAVGDGAIAAQQASKYIEFNK